jgi:hypothetical protein
VVTRGTGANYGADRLLEPLPRVPLTLTLTPTLTLTLALALALALALWP